MDLAGKKIVLGLTGGVACYKAAELTRALIKAGASVQIVMTNAATHFITPVTMQALSGNPVVTDQWDARIANNMPHIDLTRGVDAIVIAPCSADFIFKLAHGACDDLLSTLCVARPDTLPLLVAPAMNVEMWQNSATRRNVAQLKADRIAVLGPDAGEQACGETGMGRMLEPEQLLEEIVACFQPNLLVGKSVLITAGPTFEPIDPVRGITNLSSGKMGYAIARAAREAGADVTLISGPTALDAPYGVHRINVQTAEQMHDVVMSRVSSAAGLHRCRRRCRLACAPTSARRKSRRMRKAMPPRWSSTRTPTSLPPWLRCDKRRLSASVLPRNPRTCSNTRKPSAGKRTFRCWSAISAIRPSARTATNWFCLTNRVTRRCRRADKQVLARQLIGEIAKRLHA